MFHEGHSLVKGPGKHQKRAAQQGLGRCFSKQSCSDFAAADTSSTVPIKY